MAPIPEPNVPRSAGLSYEDYLELPDNEGTRYEILDGDLAVTPAPTTIHQRVLFNLARLLDRHVRERSLGEILLAPTDVILANTTVVVPDLLYVRAERTSIITRRAIEGPPDLIVEVLSTKTSKRDRETKLKLYARYGVPHYWIVHPDARWVEIYEGQRGSYRLTTRENAEGVVRPPLFPELEIHLGEIWVS
jgi:Uma2 family endonuclease